MAMLGAPDCLLISQSELVDLCRRIAAASNLPLMVDADHGFGNSLNVWRTVQELDRAGLAGISIEDTELPAPHGSKKSSLISQAEAAAKIKAAVRGRLDPQTVIIARTDLSAVPLEDSLERVRLFEAGGADAVFLAQAKSVEQIQRVAEACTLPLMLGPSAASMAGSELLVSCRVRVILTGHAPFPAALQAACEAYAAQTNPKEANMMPRLMRSDALAWLTRETELAEIMIQ